MARLVNGFPYLDFLRMIDYISAFAPISEDKAFICMIKSIHEMIPDVSPIKVLLAEALQKYPLDEDTFTTQPSLISWAYHVHAYIHTRMNNTGYLTWAEYISKFNPKVATIQDWSHSTWKIIHYLATNYDYSGEYALSYKAFVSCLQFILPCQKCREHLRNNLADHPIDQYFGTPMELFTWSYILHQMVSAQLGKKGISFQQAKSLYGML